ncbi:MAG: TMEM165/GDT1 family protein [Pseudomonadota bacterium]|jgi:putative Ca2+/H+ antiporter (TMEM165/GDT1 family)
MDLKLFLTVFGTVLLAELGDKTQLATFLFAADGETSKWTVFAGAALALVVTSAIAVAAAGLIGRWVSDKVLGYAAGSLFLALGALTLYQAARA